MDLLANFRDFVRKEGLFTIRDRLLLAVSGGMDSVTLCELSRRAGFDFEIAHCNFQLRGAESVRDEEFVRCLAAKYQVKYHINVFETLEYAKVEKKSVEEAARELRYRWFYQLIHGEVKVATDNLPKYILTAHHADDNIETVVMHFFRGTGISGLHGILPRQDRLIRPLLFARRSDIEAFVKEHQLEFVTDHTNDGNAYTRNYFRNTILPLVVKTFPETDNNVLGNIRRFREAEMLYMQSIELHKKRLLQYKGDEVHIPVLKLKKTVSLNTVLFEIIKDYGFTAHQTSEVAGLLDSETGRYVRSLTHRVLKNRNWLIVSAIKTVEDSMVLIQENDQQVFFGEGVLTTRRVEKDTVVMNTDPLFALIDLSEIKFPLLLRRWKQGDYFYPLGMQKKKKLSRFFIDQKLSLAEKEKTWVIEMDKKIIWVVGRRIDDRFKLKNGTGKVYFIVFSGNAGDGVEHLAK